MRKMERTTPVFSSLSPGWQWHSLGKNVFLSFVKISVARFARAASGASIERVTLPFHGGDAAVGFSRQKSAIEILPTPSVVTSCCALVRVRLQVTRAPASVKTGGKNSAQNTAQPANLLPPWYSIYQQQCDCLRKSVFASEAALESASARA